MSKQKVRADTPQANIRDEQLMDILLVMDKQEQSLKAAKEPTKNEKAGLTKADPENNNDFLKIDKQGNAVENFISNFLNQYSDPTRFEFFRLPLKAFKTSYGLLKELLKAKPSQAATDFAAQYRVENQDPEKIKTTNTKKQDHMAKQKETTQPTPAPAAEAPKAENRNRYNESMINWEEIGKFGISREFLKEKGMLDGMLKGYKTNQTVPISMNFGSVILKADARLSFQQSQAGPVVMAMHCIRKEPELGQPLFGHIFTDEDKKNLKESGNMGRVVELRNRLGEYVPSFVSIDKLTNEIVAMRAENVTVPKEIKGVQLTTQEMSDLKEGKGVYIEGMRAASGKEFNATIQINAEKRGIEFIFDNNKQFNRQFIGGIKLTEKQTTELSLGKAIFLEDMVRKDGAKFSAFVTINPVSQLPAYTRFNPDTPEGSREIYVPKELNGVQLTPEDRSELREGKPVFLENMVNQKGEEFSSFVKTDLETGKISYAHTQDGFTQRAEFKVPQEIWGVTPTATQRANIQDGKAVLIEGMKGYDGKLFSQYVKVNQNQGRLDYYDENPDRRKAAGQSKTEAQGQTTEAKKASAKKDKTESGTTKASKSQTAGKGVDKPKRGRGL